MILYNTIYTYIHISYIHTWCNCHRRVEETKTSRRCEKDQNYYVLTARSSFCIRNLSKKRSVYFWNDNPSITSASKRATATFSHIFFNVSAVASIRFFPAHSHRHWKERMHLHIWRLRAWHFFDGKVPGMVCLRTFQKPSTWPVWILISDVWKGTWRS